MTNPDTHSVAPSEAGIRLDRWFRRHFPALTHAHLERLLRTGQIRLDGEKAKANARIEAGQVIRVPSEVQGIPRERQRAISKEDTKFIRGLVIAEEADFFVLDKPAGLAVQGGSKTRRHIDGLLPGLASGGERPRLVHRLDRDTSGVLVVAKTAASASDLSRLLKHHKLRKIYWALVRGVPSLRTGAIDLPLAKTGRRGEERMSVEEEGQRALTRYAVVDTAGNKYAWLALEPVTGRTHQLRAHLEAIGHPIVGDPKYGSAGEQGIAPGLHLHARRIVIPRARKPFTAEAPLPAHMRNTWRFFGFEESQGLGALGD